VKFLAIARLLVRFLRAAEPEIVQILLGADVPQEDLERKLYIIRKRTEIAIRNSEIKQKNFFYIPSLSTKVLVYKGMLTSIQLGEYFLDLNDERLQSAIALGSLKVQYKYISKLGSCPALQDAWT
jgi:glutamate synthase domain-containing protein 1